jgi:hypothetical protein
MTVEGGSLLSCCLSSKVATEPSKALAQLENERAEMIQEAALELTLGEIRTDGQKVEAVGILVQFFSEL